MCQETYINPFTDFGFKRLFGSDKHKEFLISFINSTLYLSDPVMNVTYRNPEQLGERIEDRNAIYDIYCQTQAGHLLIVEMQNANQKYFLDRSVYYASFPIQEAAKSGKWNYQLPPIYTIAFLNFKLDRYFNTPQYKHVGKICDIDSGTPLYDKLTFVYFEMPKFVKGPTELKTLEDKWLYVIRNMNTFHNYPSHIQEKIFKRFFDVAEYSAFTPKEKQAYETSLKNLRDNANIVEFAEEKGVAKGIEIGEARGIEIGEARGIEIGEARGIEIGEARGIEIGKEEEKRNNARKLIAENVPLETISSALGIPIEELKKLI